MAQPITAVVSPLASALFTLDVIEANLEKLERLWKEMSALLPGGVDFSANPEYENRRRDFECMYSELPTIDGWKPTCEVLRIGEIASLRLDAMEVDEPDAYIYASDRIDSPRDALEEYRYRLNQKRRTVVRKAVTLAENEVARLLEHLGCQFERSAVGTRVAIPEWDALLRQVRIIDSLLGSAERPQGWSDLERHLHFAMVGDLQDIIAKDWPRVQSALARILYTENESIPVGIHDLSELGDVQPSGPVPVQLQWSMLDAEAFERLLFALITGSGSYENVEWSMKTDAQDRGRDLSATRIVRDPLGGVIRSRVIFQCKHWLERSVRPPDVVLLTSQVRLWEPPRVDLLVIATSGRFTQDAVAIIERHNNEDRALRIEMWPESHLEHLLAQRPAVVAEFGLRRT